MVRFTRATRKRLAPIALLAFVALALTGCMRVHMDLKVNADDTVSGTMVMAVSDSLIELMGSEAEGLFDGVDLEGEEGVTVEEYAKDGYTGQQYHLSAMPLAEFSSDEMTLTREGDEFVMSGKFDLSDNTEDMPADLTDSFDVRITFTFPGDVIETNGEVSGTTVTWTPKFGEVNEMTARAHAEGGGSGSSIGAGVIAGIVVAVLAVAAVVVVLLMNRKKRDAAQTAEAAAEPFAGPDALIAGAAQAPQSPQPGAPAEPSVAPDALTPPQAQSDGGSDASSPASPA